MGIKTILDVQSELHGLDVQIEELEEDSDTPAKDKKWRLIKLYNQRKETKAYLDEISA